MEEMDFDPETLLASGSSDPMLGKPAEQPQMATQEQHSQQSQLPPSGSFIVLQSGGSPGGGPGGVTQLGNISVSSLAPGQGARAATSRLTAVMGRAAGSAPGNLTKFIISPGQATSSAAPVRMLSGTAAGRVAAPASAPPAVVPAAGPGTLTLTSAQAQQMGLISPRKGTAIDGARQGVSPKRIVIRSSPAPQVKPGMVTGAAVAAGGTVQPPYRVLTQSGLQQAVSTARGQSVQFVRVVGSATGQPTFSTAAAAGGPLPVAPAAAVATGAAPVKIAIAPGGRMAPVQTAQRLLLPAAPPAGPAGVSAAGVTVGGAPELLRSAPAVYSRPRQAPQQPRLGRPPSTAGSGRAQTQKASAHVARPSGRGASGDVPQIRPRKPCNCTKSQCLKLYCDCFASGEFCNNCNCTNCFNSLDREEERRRAIRACLDRNPFAFKPKIGKSDNETRKHQKGCNCKKSGCLKNYCECYEAKIFCSSQCKCMGCKNYESANARPPRPGAGAAAVLEDPFSLLPAAEPGSSSGRGGGRRPGGLKVATFPVTERAPAAVRVTQDVIDATLSCLMTEAAGAATSQEAQRRVLREFGRCLSEIIDYGSRRDGAVPGMV